jgi:hypothetical protein
MSGIEDLLREAYQDAARTVQPKRVRQLALPPAAEPRRRSHALVPLVAAAAVVAAIAVAVAVPRLLAVRPAHNIPAVSAAPRFVVLLPYYGGNVSKLAVQAAGTRHVIGQVPAPHGTSWASVAATGTSTTFVAAATTSGTSHCVTMFYTLTLGPGGIQPRRGRFTFPQYQAVSLRPRR